MRIALYARVSTTDQHPEAQLAPLREYAAARGVTGCQVVEFVDHGVSGRRDSRPALDKLMEALRRGEMDTVAVVKLDRLARSVRHLTILAAQLEALDVDLVVLDQGIDTSTPAGRLMFHVLGAIGEFEGDLIRERTKAGLEAARQRGAQLGRPALVQGERLASARSMRTRGYSILTIAQALGVSRSTAQRALTASDTRLD